jgi:hypothetical protein
MPDTTIPSDHIDTLLTSIVSKIVSSPLTEEQKAEAFARISSGMHKLIWPIIVLHIPEGTKKTLMAQTTPLTIDQYADVMEQVFQNPAVGREIFDQVYGALEEVDALVDATFS